MTDTQYSHPTPLRAGGPQVAAVEPPENILFELENRYASLRSELVAVEKRLREVRTAAELCPECGGSGQRWSRGGLYGEFQTRPCACRKP